MHTNDAPLLPKNVGTRPQQYQIGIQVPESRYDRIAEQGLGKKAGERVSAGCEAGGDILQGRCGVAGITTRDRADSQGVDGL
jgi:hypothetical protein